MSRFGTFLSGLRSFLADERGELRIGSPILLDDDPDAGGGGDVDDESVEPEVLEIGEDVVFRVPGFDDPIPAREFRDRFIPQDEYTRQRQREKAEMESLRQQVQQSQRAAQQYYYALAQGQRGQPGQQQGGPQQSGNPEIDRLIKRVEGQGWVSTDDFAEALRLAQGGGAQTAYQQQLVQSVLQMAQQNRALQQQVQTIQSSMTADRVARIEEHLTSEYEITASQARDIVQNWEPEQGETLEEMVDKVARDYEKENRELFNASQKRKLSDAKKKQRAGLAGKGGQGSPSKPVKFDPRKSASDVAREMEAEGLFAEG